MAIEKQRMCGYRIVNKLYLVGRGVSLSCDRLNYDLHPCPCCGGGVKFSRGLSYVDWEHFAGKHAGKDGAKCECGKGCPICYPPAQRIALMPVGTKYYGTPDEFIKEALAQGISKRINSIPKGVTLGKTWVFFAHPKAGSLQPAICPDGTPQLDKDGNPVIEPSPAVFYAFVPDKIEMLIWNRDATPDKLKELGERGITPIIVPDGDIDHTAAGAKVCLQKRKKVKAEPGTVNMAVPITPAPVVQEDD